MTTLTAAQLEQTMIARQNQLVEQLQTKYCNYIQMLLNQKEQILQQMQAHFKQNMDYIHRQTGASHQPSTNNNMSWSSDPPSFGPPQHPPSLSPDDNTAGTKKSLCVPSFRAN